MKALGSEECPACRVPSETLAPVLALLQRERRASYRALNRRFELDEEYLQDLRADFEAADRSGASPLTLLAAKAYISLKKEE